MATHPTTCWSCRSPAANHCAPKQVIKTACQRQNISIELSVTVRNRCTRAATPWHDWDRSTLRLPSGRRIAADVRVTRVERVHHGDGPPTRRRISQPQQAMPLLSTWHARLQTAVGGRWRSTVWEHIEQSASHTVPATSTTICSITEL